MTVASLVIDSTLAKPPMHRNSAPPLITNHIYQGLHLAFLYVKAAQVSFLSYDCY